MLECIESLDPLENLELLEYLEPLELLVLLEVSNKNYAQLIIFQQQITITCSRIENPDIAIKTYFFAFYT